MSRYIDADKFIEWLNVGHLRSPSEICYSEGDVKVMIDMQPTANVVEAVLCKDCKYSKLESCEEPELEDCPYVWRCRLDDNCYSENDFCSYGKRRI